MLKRMLEPTRRGPNAQILRETTRAAIDRDSWSEFNEQHTFEVAMQAHVLVKELGPLGLDELFEQSDRDLIRVLHALGLAK